jgi:TBC1 domain family protein 5
MHSQRNIPDLAASLVRSPSPSFSTFPLTDDKPPEERPPWEPRTRFEMERDISQLRSRHKRLGEALGWIVDALLQDETEVEDRQRLQKRKREALESLSYVRDILIGSEVEIEETRLLSEEETMKRSLKKELPIPSLTPSTVVIPSPMPVIDSRQRGASSWTHRSRSPPHSSPPVTSPISSTSTIGGLAMPSKSEASSLNRASPPWNHTRSSFSGSLSSLPAETLPRLPPPTSTGVRRPSPGGHKISDQTPHWSQAHHDPLGALR